MKRIFLFRALPLAVLALPVLAQSALSDPTSDQFALTDDWQLVADVSLSPDRSSIVPGNNESGTVLVNEKAAPDDDYLLTQHEYSDQVIRFEYLVPESATPSLYLQGRYEISLAGGDRSKTLSPQTAGGVSGGFNRDVDAPFDGVPPLLDASKPAGEWQEIQIRFRTLRYDAANNKTENALLLEVRLNGEVVQKDVPIPYYSDGAINQWESASGPLAIDPSEGQIAIRNFQIAHANYDAVDVSDESATSNADDLIDHVALGQTTFTELGCIECHTIKQGDTSFKTGPNLYGLFTLSGRKREIVEASTGNRFLVDMDRSYMRRSIRHPGVELAIRESGDQQGEAFLPVMPPYNEDLLSDAKIDAIWRYLGTLNKPQDQGPIEVLVEKTGPKQYEPLEDTMQVLVDNRVRIQRGPLEAVSGRAIHVGLPNGINYSFDPRTLAIEKLWQGGFLDGSGEWKNRGGEGFAPGYERKEISLQGGGSLLAPLNADGKPIDFSFKEAVFKDWNTIRSSLYSDTDPLDMLDRVDAAFEGYEIDSSHPEAPPIFEYRIGQNRIRAQASFAEDGSLTYRLRGKLDTPQAFRLNTDVLSEREVSTGFVDSQGLWKIRATNELDATLTAKIRVASQAWRPRPSAFDHLAQALEIEPTEATLPAGYRSEQYLPPKDNYGRPLLFEPLGIDLAPDGTIVVATRAAGIWRIVDGEWRLFAEGLLDSLGVVVEDESGLQLVVGQKPELTRITDTNRDGLADSYKTLVDEFSYHSNYHSYLHGPVRDDDGNYYVTLNLLHTDKAIYKAKGEYMGTSGGFSGWAIKLAPNGEFQLWTNGLRSPSGLAVAPDGRIWYAESQGEYVATSKLFVLKGDRFYGHPSSLVDLPGMTPDSPEIQWNEVAENRERPAVLFPHNRLANSPGNPAWDTTDGQFGPFAGQIFIGDQTQSKLIRVGTEIVNGREQGWAIPFGANLQSGIMRPVFLPDGSLLVGQTGRGWQAQGGHIASLQRIYWDGQTVPPSIHSIAAERDGFTIRLTKPARAGLANENLLQSIVASSWTYRDAPDYGSPELDLRQETLSSAELSNDRTSIRITLPLTSKRIHPQQTARVYHLQLNAESIFGEKINLPLEAYYTRY